MPIAISWQGATLGANTFTAHNHVFNAKGDGENIFYGSWFAVSQIVSASVIR